MRKSWRRISHTILWAWLVTLAIAAWPSTATAVTLFAALVLWETARALKVSRPQTKHAQRWKTPGVVEVAVDR